MTDQAATTLNRLAAEKVAPAAALDDTARASPGLAAEADAADQAARAAEQMAAAVQGRLAAEEAERRVARGALGVAQAQSGRAAADLAHLVNELAAIEAEAPLAR